MRTSNHETKNLQVEFIFGNDKEIEENTLQDCDIGRSFLDREKKE